LDREGTLQRGGVGAVRRISSRLPAPAIVEEITAFEPKRRLAYKALAGVPLKNYSGDVRLTASGTGTVVSYTITADQRIPLVESLLVKAIAAGLLGGLARAVAKAS
jgi:hypothetical protein